LALCQDVLEQNTKKLSISLQSDLLLLFCFIYVWTQNSNSPKILSCINHHQALRKEKSWLATRIFTRNSEKTARLQVTSGAKQHPLALSPIKIKTKHPLVEYRKEELVPKHTWNPEHFCGEDSKFPISKAHETVVTFNIAAKSFNYFIYIPRKSMVAQRQPPYRFCITTISWRRTQTKASNALGQPHHVILLIQILLAEDFVQHVHKTGSKKQLIKFRRNPNPFVITRWCRTCYMILSGPSHLRTDCQILSITLQLSPPFNSPFSMTSQKENTPSLRFCCFFGTLTLL